MKNFCNYLLSTPCPCTCQLGRAGSCSSSAGLPCFFKTVENNDNKGDDEDGDDGEPEEGVGVEVAGAHHDHVHLRCAPVLERGNLHTDDEGNDDGDDGGGDGDIDVENNHFTDGDAPISGRI